ncbi:hypothetical protein [Phenylobacterium sp.]|uniref:hypothetical protein n=1 Tax=Phenylobacterium sp. TaxID=1871053 RepID=UPI00374CED07
MVKPKRARANPAAMRLGLIRQLHVYLSVFVAPSLLFFAATGALQTFRIPDQKTAPMVIQKLARLHKDDVFAEKPPRPKRAESHDAGKGSEAKSPEKPPEKPPEKRSVTAMKWFGVTVSIGMAITTLFGLWMALVYSRNKLLVWLLLMAGIATPMVIAAL